jgi:hypothetical protein
MIYHLIILLYHLLLLKHVMFVLLMYLTFHNKIHFTIHKIGPVINHLNLDLITMLQTEITKKSTLET